MKRLLTAVAVCFVTAAGFIAAPAPPAHLNTAVPPAVPADGRLADLAFLSGTWRGEMNGEFVEEIWSEARGGAMMGMFRWLGPSGASRLYEMLTITGEGEDTVLRMRHFNAAMIGWASEKDGPATMKLAESGTRRAVFVSTAEDGGLHRITFQRPEDDRLTIDVEFRDETPTLNFRFKRK